MRLWDYAKTIFWSQKLQISYATPELGPKKPEIGANKCSDKLQNRYTNQQKINRNGHTKKYTTCRLYKTLRSRTTGRQACIYIGGNKTFELMYENNCPKQYKCVYNPWSKEPSIDDVVDSLNSIKK